MLDWEAAYEVVQPLASKWSLLVVAELAQEAQGYNSLLHATQLERKALDRSLGRLEDAGIVVRDVRQYRPLRVRYRLSADAQGLVEPLTILARWWRVHEETS